MSFSRREHLRGILVALHVIAICVGSIPILMDERGLTEENWNHPIARQEFADWGERLGKTPEEVSAIAWDAANGSLKVIRGIQAPFQPYYHLAGTRQRWRMFPGAVEEPLQLCIVVSRQESGSVSVITNRYVMGTQEEEWLQSLFACDRFRAALNLYAWGMYPESHDGFVAWLKRKAEGRTVQVEFRPVKALGPQ